MNSYSVAGNNNNNNNGKPHAVCIPYPAQGHINPMLKVAQLLYFHGFYITFVNTHYNHNRLIKSKGSNSLSGLPDFRFESIPDGLPDSDHNEDATQDIPLLCASTSKNCLVPFLDLLYKINGSRNNTSGCSCSGSSCCCCRRLPPQPAVSCIVSDGSMSFTLDAAQELGIPEVLMWTPSACGVLAYTQFPLLVHRGFSPFKDESYLTNGDLETTIDWFPGMKNIRLKDIPSFIRTTDPNDIMLNYVPREISKIPRSSALILNTFQALENNVLEALSSMFPRVYSIGPLHLLADKQIPGDYPLRNIGSNLWKEDPDCMKWLDLQNPNSVVYINFGSITVMTPDELNEFAWGLANSKKPFLWIVRPDLVSGEYAVLPGEFLTETESRGKLASWCNQEQVLKHPSIGLFLSHMGWNSTIESLSAGVPLICWPFFSEQLTNCKFACNEWGIGMEINDEVKRDVVEILVRELMEGDKGKEMKKKAMEWKMKAEEAIKPGGSSHQNFEKFLAVLANKQLKIN